MAKKKKPRGKPIAKGQKLGVGNKSKKDQPQYDREERLARKIDTSMVVRYVTLNSHLTVEEIKSRLNDRNRGKISFLEYMILRCMVVCAQTGDTNRLDMILDRLIGKVPQKTIHAVEDPLEGKEMDELLKMKRDLEETNRKTLQHIEKLPAIQQKSNTLEAEYRESEPSVIEHTTEPNTTDTN